MQIQSPSRSRMLAAHQAAGAGVAANLLHLTKFNDKLVLGTTGAEDCWGWDYQRTSTLNGTMPIACGALLAGHLSGPRTDAPAESDAISWAAVNASKQDRAQQLRMPSACDLMRQLPGEIASHNPALYSHMTVLVSLFRDAVHRLALRMCERFELTPADVELAVAETLNRIAEGPAPSRVIISRDRGWQPPPGTIKVARPSKWGNPFQIGMKPDVQSRKETVRRFQEELLRGGLKDRDQLTLLSKLPLLKGRHLACWCKSGEPCHANVLSKFAAHLP